MLATLLVVALAALAGCASAHTGVVYQTSTIDALLDGNYDGENSISDMARHGDMGLGTFDQLDGEMVVLHGDVYQVRSDGRVVAVPVRGRSVLDESVVTNGRTPFAAVTFFHAQWVRRIDQTTTYAALQRLLDQMQDPAQRLAKMVLVDRSENGHAFAIVIDGTFTAVRTRSVAPQSPPYPRLADAAKTQAVFDLHDVTGTLVGFWFPPSMQYVNVPGYHFHFITADRTAGGHVLDLTMKSGTVRVMELNEVRIALPSHAPATQPAGDRSDEMNRAERQ